MKHKLSVVIITKNEAQNITRCIESVSSVADEVLVIDSDSTDNTAELAQKCGAKVISIPWKGYAQTKNEGNSQATHDYILSMDADEALSEELKQSILNLKNSGLDGYYAMNRLNNYCGKWIKTSGWYPDQKIRLFSRNECSWTGDFVHETLQAPSDIEGKFLKGDLLHYSYSSPEDHENRTMKYAELAAQKLYASGRKRNVLIPYISSWVKFIKMYILKLGFTDGKAGFQIALTSAKGIYRKYKRLNQIHAQS